MTANEIIVESALQFPFAACPLCESKNHARIIEADCTRHSLYHPTLPKTLSWLECRDCWHVYTETYWSDEALSLIFSKTHDNQTPGKDMEAGRFVCSEIVEKVINSGAALGRWLDVGFGNGALMFTAAEYGFLPVGLDLRPSTVQAMKAIGFDAHCKDISDFTEDGPFEVISMADCLEHIPFPKKALAAVKRLLAQNGRLFLSMPNSGAPLWGYLTQTGTNPYWSEIEHYHNFSLARLDLLLNEIGFSRISYGISKRYRCCMEVIAVKLET